MDPKPMGAIAPDPRDDPNYGARAENAFYHLLEQVDNAKKRLEDPNISEEEKKKIIESIERAEQSFEELDVMNKDYEAKKQSHNQELGSTAVTASNLTNEEARKKAEGQQLYVGTDGVVWPNPEDARKGAVEDNNWHSYTEK